MAQWQEWLWRGRDRLGNTGYRGTLDYSVGIFLAYFYVLFYRSPIINISPTLDCGARQNSPEGERRHGGRVVKSFH
jgi:hypothetical protein